MDLEQKAEDFMNKHKMLGAGDKILVGFSGGSDSSALLHFLVEKFGKKNIYAAHLNHSLRGSDSDNDEKFASEICGAYGVKIFTEQKNIRYIAKKTKKSEEEAGREARYEFFGRICAKLGGSIKTATAHTAPDNTESVMLNLARGTGAAGLCGIAPVRGSIIRPFLSCEKNDIISYCKKNNINFTEDKSNGDTRYARNFMRLSIASKLRERYENLDGNILKMSEIMRDTVDFIDLQAENILNEHPGGIQLNLFCGLHTAVRRAVIIKMCEKAGSRLDFKLISELDAALRNGGLVRQDLPGKTAAEVSGGIFKIYKEKEDYRILRKERKNGIKEEIKKKKTN
ncbi:MAG: tRNA lysidine(34) synthetase TilS [Oscillospiraceae bacterium]|nr:tRNA lysidine(34) synthetase TilS [Oscillospiraceae bacterium]